MNRIVSFISENNEKKKNSNLAEIFRFDIEANVCINNDCVLRGGSMLIYSHLLGKDKKPIFVRQMRAEEVLNAQGTKNIFLVVWNVQ